MGVHIVIKLGLFRCNMKETYVGVKSVVNTAATAIFVYLAMSHRWEHTTCQTAFTYILCSLREGMSSSHTHTHTHTITQTNTHTQPPTNHTLYPWKPCICPLQSPHRQSESQSQPLTLSSHYRWKIPFHPQIASMLVQPRRSRENSWWDHCTDTHRCTYKCTYG